MKELECKQNCQQRVTDLSFHNKTPQTRFKPRTPFLGHITTAGPAFNRLERDTKTSQKLKPRGPAEKRSSQHHLSKPKSLAALTIKRPQPVSSQRQLTCWSQKQKVQSIPSLKLVKSIQTKVASLGIKHIKPVNHVKPYLHQHLSLKPLSKPLTNLNPQKTCISI